MCGINSVKFCFSVKSASWIVTFIHITYLMTLSLIEIIFEPDFFDISFLSLGKS